MEPSSRCRARPWTSCSLHHHHHHHPLIVFPHHHQLLLCPHHTHCHHNHLICQGHASASFAPPPPNSRLASDAALQNEASLFKDAADHGTRLLQEQEQEQELWGFEKADEADDDLDDEPIFVLTDEWKEFFAKSEAKRKLEKKLAKRKQQK